MATKVNASDEVVEEKKPTKRKFENDELIDCRSITNGELLMVGNRTKNLYSWADYGDVIGVEYQDLIFEVRSSNSSFANYPRFIVLDDDFVKQNKSLQGLYDSMYTDGDLKEILSHNTNELKQIIPQLPLGAKSALKGLAATMIENGQLDSVSKIKALDEMFETQMFAALSDN